ncbi:uncharacterized protein PHACADRAFT_31094 [Phanerochaete carnosa HHB-10118-sp]|uniref:Protein kinase domain-containing protein n=1 Tax=Phanerochaete carnosa (strain HHB-10118-sp) TaxID=650164 RepID=K5URS8_PHACS|nr:uncharacterized protein PHACADRAFT_31094 [Phanerochaete carnosa HHB-10118-sp]EKM52601.1 hypothetical protein PHACADRAFT_31094 [Phanerochaete carnosa HHB-10118-sp]
MPLRAIRKRCTADNALTVAIAATTASHELAGLLAFPPDLQTNKRECFRLAKRCVTLLADVKDAMSGHWEDAPETLLKNIAKFERILENLHEDLRRDIEGKWHDRLLRKSAIEKALIECTVMIDDAARSFQIVALIHIHRAVGDPRAKDPGSKTKALPTRSSDEFSTESSPAPPYNSAGGTTTVNDNISDLSVEDISLVSRSPMSSSFMEASFRSSFDSEYVLVSESPTMAPDSVSATSLSSSFQISPPLSSSTSLAEAPARIGPSEETDDNLSAEEQSFLAELASFDDKGFQRYDYSSIRSARGKKTKLSTGWWAGAQEFEADGRTVLMLPYAAPDSPKGRLRAARRWLRDVKTLQNVHHPNLPMLIGYSGTDAPTPFILLANGLVFQTRLPQALLLSGLANASLLECTKLLIGLYKETLDAALYLQRQLSLSESKTQDYVEHASFRVSPYSDKKVVMGLPDPEAGVAEMQSWRNYGLAWSIRDVWLSVLPNRGRVNRLVDLYDALEPTKQIKANHFALLARTLLPGNDTPEAAQARLETLARTIEPPVESHEEEEQDEVDEFIALYGTESNAPSPYDQSTGVVEKLTLKRLRQAALQAGTHGVTWSNNFVPPHLFRVGDVGYIRSEGTEDKDGSDGEKEPKALWSYGGFDRFVRMCNILDEAAPHSGSEIPIETGPRVSLESKPESTGWTTAFDHGRFEKTELQAFEAGGGMLGWPIVTSPGTRLTVHMLHSNYIVNVNDAWSLLLARAPELARKHGVRPEDLMLVTRSGTEYRVKVHDIRSVPPSFYTPPLQHFPAHHSPFPPRPGFPGYPHGFPGHHPHGGFAPPPPLPSYIFTSEAQGFEPSLQDTPVCLPHQAPPRQQNARCLWVLDGAYGFMNYVRLCAEDFD